LIKTIALPLRQTATSIRLAIMDYDSLL